MIVSLPVSDTLRGQLLSLIGILLSAAISLSSTTFIREAARKAGLTDAFVQVRDLGDFSVLYRVAGLLEEVRSLISTRSKLREAILDSLHGIEIVSPSFMNTRAINDTVFIPRSSHSQEAAQQVAPEEVAFDKADEAASVEQIRKSLELISAELEALDNQEKGVAENARPALLAKKARLVEALEIAEERRRASEDAERTGAGE